MFGVISSLVYVFGCFNKVIIVKGTARVLSYTQIWVGLNHPSLQRREIVELGRRWLGKR
jgi:hypothetical protein